MNINNDNKKKIRQKPFIIRFALVMSGMIMLALGVTGILIPLLPTTPFLLAASLLFVHSSERLNTWLHTNTLTKIHMQRLHDKKGMTLKTKIIILAAVWTLLIIATVFIAENKTMKIVFPSLGVIKTIFFFTVMKTIKE